MIKVDIFALLFPKVDIFALLFPKVDNNVKNGLKNDSL